MLYYLQCHLLKLKVSSKKLKKVEILKTYDVQGKHCVCVYIHDNTYVHNMQQYLLKEWLDIGRVHMVSGNSIRECVSTLFYVGLTSQ